MKLQLVGCSHHGTHLAVRERLAFSPAQAREALEGWRRRFPATEAVLLSTCNRVEVYTASEESAHQPSHEEVVEFLAGFHNVPIYEVFDDLLERTGDDVVRHLFTVAASLDSMVVGEPQILAQVKDAYKMANELASTGPLTHAVFQGAVRVAKRVQNETAIHERRVSIPSVAVSDFARQIFERFDDKRVLIIGAGEMAEETMRYLKEEGAKEIVIVNRSRERAQSLADSAGGRVVGWERLHDELIAADLVVSTTGASETLIPLETYRKRIEPARFQRPLFVLDLAMPRDFDPAIGECVGVYLYSIDDLRTTCEQNRKSRDRELPAALAIVEEETARFMADLHHRATAPIVRRLRDQWETIKGDELARLLNKMQNLDEAGRREITQSFDRLVNKLLHPPLETLRDEARSGPPHGLLNALRRLFQIKD